MGPNGGKGVYFMDGLSFRVRDVSVSPLHNMYAVSFFHGDYAALLNANKTADWAEPFLVKVRPKDLNDDGDYIDAYEYRGLDADNDGLCDLENGHVFMVIWKVTDGEYEIIGYADLWDVQDAAGDPILIHTTDADGAEIGEVKNFNTIVIRINESYDLTGDADGLPDDSTKRVNDIRVWAVPASIYPRGTVDWNYATYFEQYWTPITFEVINYTDVVIDAQGTTLRVPDWSNVCSGDTVPNPPARPT